MNPTIKRLLAYCARYPRWLVQAGICLLLATGAEVAGPLLIKLFIDDYLAPRQLVWPAIAAIAAGYLGLQVLSAAGFYLQSLRFNRIAQAVVQTLREQVFATAIRLPARYFDKHRSGSLISRITNDTEAIMNLYVQVIGLLVQKVVLLCGILISMALLDLRLMLVCATLLPAVGAVMWLYQKLSVPVVRATRSLLSEINSRLNESLQGMPVIQAMVQERHFANAFAEVNQQHWSARLKSLKINGILLRPLIDLFYMMVLIGLLALFAKEGLSAGGAIQVGVLYAFISYLGRMIEPLIEMTNQLNQLQQAMVAAAQAFSKGLAHGALPVHRKDEVGELARSFHDMEQQISRQITELNASRDAMAHLAHHDALTGLPNRRMFEQRLAQALELSRRSGRDCALLFVDLDDFKAINDTRGHAVGDLVLQAVARVILGAVRQADTVARLAGDEFTVLCENVDSEEAALQIVAKLEQAFAPPLDIEGQPFPVRASIGVSLFPRDAQDAHTLLASADAAMYRVKQSHRPRG